MRTLSAAIIAKTEGGDSLKRAVASIRPFVDEVCLTWTCKETEERPRIEGVDSVHYFDGCNAQEDCRPESACQCKRGDIIDFSSARNYSFSVTSGDLITYVDSDDTLTGSGDLRAHYTEGLRTVFPYEYGYDASGVCISHHFIDRVMPKGASWDDPVHNQVAFPPGMRIVTCNAFTWKHARTRVGEDSSNARALRILRHWENHPKYKNHPRFVYYLGRVHMDCGILGRASVELERAFGLESHPDVKAITALCLARCYPPKYGLAWAHRALELRPEWPAPWLCLARTYHALAQQGVEPKKNERLAHQFLRVGLSCDEPETLMILNPTDKRRTRELILGSALSEEVTMRQN
jgi:hypothetical protein